MIVCIWWSITLSDLSFWWNACSRWLPPYDCTSIYPQFLTASRSPSSRACSSPPSWSFSIDCRWRASRGSGIGRQCGFSFAKIIQDCLRGEHATASRAAVSFRLSIVDRSPRWAWITCPRTSPVYSVSSTNCSICWLPIRAEFDRFWPVCEEIARTPPSSHCINRARSA